MFCGHPQPQKLNIGAASELAAGLLLPWFLYVISCGIVTDD